MKRNRKATHIQWDVDELEDLELLPTESEKRRDAAEYAKMYNGLPHKVDEIERKRREAFEKEMEKA